MSLPGINPEEEFRNQNLAEWKSFLTELFNNSIPKSIVWKGREEIVSILQKIGAQENVTHLFFPNGGGLDLTGTRVSYEEDCIELHFEGLVYIVKPDHLAFESFGEEYEWAYFRLETLELAPSGIYKDNSSGREILTELHPGNYADIYVWDLGLIENDENEEEESSAFAPRVVARIFSGSYVIFAKGSAYNKSDETYDAIHNKMTESEFRQFAVNSIEYRKSPQFQQCRSSPVSDMANLLQTWRARL